jgi:hypothetical protein
MDCEGMADMSDMRDHHRSFGALRVQHEATMFWIAVAVWFMIICAALVMLWAACALSGQIAERNKDLKERSIKRR